GWVAAIRRMRVRMERERVRPPEAARFAFKLGYGSLADVQFAVELALMRHGGAHPEVRTRRTLEAIESLAAARFLEGSVALAGWRRLGGAGALRGPCREEGWSGGAIVNPFGGPFACGPFPCGPFRRSSPRVRSGRSGADAASFRMISAGSMESRAARGRWLSP